MTKRPRIPTFLALLIVGLKNTRWNALAPSAQHKFPKWTGGLSAVLP
jgi:hypothetical protein